MTDSQQPQKATSPTLNGGGGKGGGGKGGSAAPPELNLERKARKEAQKALKAQQAALKSSSCSSSCAPKPSSSKSSDKLGGKAQSSSEQLSRALAYILRHGAEKEGLTIRPDGYISLRDLLDRPRVKSVNMASEEGSGGGKRKPELADVQAVVESNDKKRFELAQEGQEWLVRAVQGHSLKSVSELSNTAVTLSNYRSILSTTTGDEDQGLLSELDAKLNITQDERERVELIHGTNAAAWEEILASGGLKAMRRNHIHLAKGKFGEKGVISGMRKNASRLVFVDVKKAMEDGVQFEVSRNGVVLTAGKEGVLGNQYFIRVEDGKGNLVWQP